MPRLLWRRCRLWTTCRYSKMSSVTISSARPRPAIGGQRLRFTVPAGSGGAATVRARRPLPAVLDGSRILLPRVEVSLAQPLPARVTHHVGPEDELDDAAREILPSVA